MIEIVFLYVLALIWIIFASVQDVKMREIADWLNYSLIIFALSFRFFYSLFNSNFEFLYQGLIWLGIFFVLGNVLYFSKFFAGGDAKLMMALGVILPFSDSFSTNLQYIGVFLLIFFIVTVVQSLGASIILSIKYRKKFKKEFRKLWQQNKKITIFVELIGLVLMLVGFFKILIFYLGILIFISPLILIFAKAVDEASMVKKVKPNVLTVGDLLYKDVRVGRKIIKANWDGLTKQDITLLKKHKKELLVIYGIPFSPVFLISFLIFIFVYSF